MDWMHWFVRGIAAVYVTAVLSVNAWAVEIVAPGGKVAVRIDVVERDGHAGVPVWSVRHGDREVLLPGRLGFELEGGPGLLDGFVMEGFDRTTHLDTWRPVYGQWAEVPNRYNEMTVDLVQPDEPARKMRLVVRAYDEGAAIRYVFPQQDSLDEATITNEHTQFRFAEDYTTWAVYSAQGRYERATLSQVKPNCERPLTVRLADDLHAAIGEAALVDFARMRLRPAGGSDFTLEAMLASEVDVRTPYASPWRMVMIADSPARLIEQSYLILNLNEPTAIEDTSWIRPGKVIREVTLTTAGGKACVDFAKKMNLQYIEYDAGWYGHEYDDASDATTITVDPKRSPGPLDLQEVIHYARENGIGVWVYVNRRALEKQLDEILPLYQSWGIAGVKYGFVQVGSQEWTSWLHEAVRKAADHRLMVDIHDEYRPTGYSRTYPNLLTQEGIGGNETMPPAEQDLVYPFTRYLCGAADYTVCWTNNRVKNTLAHQLAASVVYCSPLQFLFWYDRPQNVPDTPAVEFFRHVPTVWDDTRVLHGQIGEYITIARRSGKEWFLGSMNAVERRRLEIPLTFLDRDVEYTAYIYSDAAPDGGNRTGVAVKELSVRRGDKITVDMAHNGGQAVRLVPNE